MSQRSATTFLTGGIVDNDGAFMLVFPYGVAMRFDADVMSVELSSASRMLIDLRVTSAVTACAPPKKRRRSPE